MRVSAACVALVVVVGLTSCSSDDDASSTTRSSSAAPSTTVTSPGPSSTNPSSTSPSSTSPTASSVAPAVGKRHEQFGFSFVLPKVFEQTDASSLSAQFFEEQTGMIVTAGQVPALGSPTVDEAAALDLKHQTDLTRQPDRVVGGQPVYVLTLAPDGPGSSTKYRLGRGVANRTLDLTFTYDTFLTTDAAATALIESVLATLQWDE